MQVKYTPDPAMVAEIAQRLATGEHFISRIRTSKHFLIVDGAYEDVLVGEEVRAAVKTLSGVELEEFVPPRYPGEHGLRFPLRLLEKAKQAIEQALAQGSSERPAA